MPAVMPGTTRKGIRAARERRRLLAAAAENERIAALEPQHALAFARKRMRRSVMSGCCGEGLPPRLPA